MTIKKKSEEANQKEEDSAFIQKCLYDTLVKYNRKHIDIPYKYLVTCLMDWRQISQSAVCQYLDILEVRGIIKIKKINSRDKVIEYEPKEKIETFDVDKHLEEIKQAIPQTT